MTWITYLAEKYQNSNNKNDPKVFVHLFSFAVRKAALEKLIEYLWCSISLYTPKRFQCIKCFFMKISPLRVGYNYRCHFHFSHHSFCRSIFVMYIKYCFFLELIMYVWHNIYWMLLSKLCINIDWGTFDAALELRCSTLENKSH